ncbi:MAG: zinc finger-like domain-containing protein [Bacteroides sp.]|nr:zinc finger-like domain-containing protein [Bacteroidales bacterium]MCM1068713.1 zinc finger-like domain-containing protein [Prevotella sp.]MCM1354687.1 zinc finger-like domain-containing protein [Bacteroides sp.]MCM1403765.1 zinc finger-like domain-containing protein [Bacteroides sp.]MCM1443517.1 zinc finger-like domain-containing protein [Muribaculum sp.]
MNLSKHEDVVAAITGNYPNKKMCMDLAHQLSVHANGEMPDDKIMSRRPMEPEEIKNYRRTIYVPKTKQAISKVIHSLEKIRRAQDWSIKYDKETIPSAITEKETLEQYCEFQFPTFTSVTNWAFSELLKRSLIDANGIVAVVIENLPKNKSEYCKPVAKFFGCEQIVEFVENEYVVLRSKDTTTYYVETKNGRGRRINTNGAIYYILTQNEFVKYEQTGASQYDPKQVFVHNCGTLPAWKAGGIFKARINNDTVYESRLAGMIPDLDEAAREYSDLQAEIIQHIHSEKYAYTNTECPHCNGNGKVMGEDSKTITCSHCNGTGRVLNTSPYGIHLVDAARAGELQVPTPPIGYIQKDTSIAALQDQRVRNHIKDALAAVNMEFLAETPIDQSGVAKAYDANELNNFVNSVAEDLVRNLDNVYYFINEYRYRTIVPNDENRRSMLPAINVPTKFDIANTTILMQELQGARQAEANPETLRVLETNYAKMQFNTSPEVAERLQTVFDLDPLFGVKEENKMTMLQNGGITETAYIISCNIHAFVRRAIFEDNDFCKKNYDDKLKVLESYANDVRTATEKDAEQKALKGLDFGGLENLSTKSENGKLGK